MSLSIRASLIAKARPDRDGNLLDLTKIDEYADQQKLGSKEKARYIEGIFGTPKVIENYTVHGENSKERDGEEVRESNEGPKSRQYWSKM